MEPNAIMCQSQSEECLDKRVDRQHRYKSLQTPDTQDDLTNELKSIDSEGVIKAYQRAKDRIHAICAGSSAR